MSIAVKAHASRPEKELADLAYEKLRDKILRGELGFGAEISRRDIANELAISVLPVSVALQRLENEHLVESIRRVTTRVRVPTVGDIRGFYTVREAIESQAARLVAAQADNAGMAELTRLADHLDQMEAGAVVLPEYPAQQLFELRREHMAFHLRIAELSGCPMLCDILSKNQILTFNWFYDHLFGRRPLPSRWHGCLVDAIQTRDAEAADRAMRMHVRHRMDEVLQRLEPFLDLNHERLGALINRTK
jgi:GntR family transcriptional regulator, rspAB operon transcriptional repressor